MDKLIKWLNKEIKRCENEIDNDGPFYITQAEKDAYEKVIEKIYKLKEK